MLWSEDVPGRLYGVPFHSGRMTSARNPSPPPPPGTSPACNSSARVWLPPALSAALSNGAAVALEGGGAGVSGLPPLPEQAARCEGERCSGCNPTRVSPRKRPRPRPGVDTISSSAGVSARERPNAPGWTRPPGECQFPWVALKGSAPTAIRTTFPVRSMLTVYRCSCMASRFPGWHMKQQTNTEHSLMDGPEAA